MKTASLEDYEVLIQEPRMVNIEEVNEDPLGVTLEDYLLIRLSENSSSPGEIIPVKNDSTKHEDPDVEMPVLMHQLQKKKAIGDIEVVRHNEIFEIPPVVFARLPFAPVISDHVCTIEVLVPSKPVSAVGQPESDSTASP